MSFKGLFQPNPIHDSLIIHWKSVNYEMLINTYRSWHTFLASITRSSNPIHTQMLTLPWTHTPSALILTHCSCGGRFSSFLWMGCPIFPLSPMAVVDSLVPVWPCCSTHSGWWETPMNPSNLGLEGSHWCPCCQPAMTFIARFLYQGSAATPGFLPLHYYFSCLFLYFFLS